MCEKFLTIAGRHVGHTARIRDEHWDREGTFEGVRIDEGRTYLIFSCLKRRRRFSSDPFLPYHVKGVEVAITNSARFEDVSHGREIYIALLPSVCSIYLT
ncbi:MAG: hypothetical protein KBD24_01545 [Candidatus Pacebacteria bacterium]|nr:hypothetical protein [Candidatus Paceibacterota bacterium]